MTRDEALQAALVALGGGHIDRAYGYVQDLLEQTERQPLTEEQILELNTFKYMGITCVHVQVDDGLIGLARAIEAAHGIGEKHDNP
jgi:hypothetical protein